MSLSPPRDFDSKDASFIEIPTLDHDQSNIFQIDKVYVKDVPCVDVDAVGGNFNLETRLDILANICDIKGNSDLEALKPFNCTTDENHPHFKLDILKYSSSIEPETKDTSGGVSSPQTSQSDDHAPSGSPSSTEPVAINSDSDECMNESTPSSPASDIAENGSFYSSLNGCGFNHYIGNSDMDITNMEVVLHPDYVIYQDNYYMGTKLTFSQCYIQIMNSTAYVKQRETAFDIEWAVDDLIDINCHLFQSSGMVMMKLCAVSSNAGQSNHVSRTSGIEELKVVVVDGNWSLRHKQITSLTEKYLHIWNTVLDMDVDDDEKFPLGPRCYFQNFQESFDEVVYPKGDPDAVTLSKRDIDLLKPDTFINDTIIDFYIQYLKSNIQEKEKPTFHFFNSFFFRKLADMDRNPSSASDGKAAFQRVHKWTRKVNLFEKDYIFIPVNFSYHWSLIVICHPGEVVSFNDKEPDKSLRVPCILHMDSMKGYHSGLKNLVQSYLWEEWKERQKDTCGGDLSSRFLNMRFLPVAVPQQINSFDCGLFLLHYLELFLAEAAVNFNPFKLTKFSNFLNLDWFLPEEAYIKRTLIQRLIFELEENQGSHEGFSSDYSDDHYYTETNEKTDILCPDINGDLSTSHSDQKIDVTLLSASSPLDPQSFNTSGMVLKELFEPGATAGTLLGHCQSLEQQSSDHDLSGSSFSMEKDTDLSEQLMQITTDPNFQQESGISLQSCSLTYLTRGCGMEISHRPRISIQSEHCKTESSLDTSSCASGDSDDIGIIENFPIRNEVRSTYEDERGEKSGTFIENFEHLSDIAGSAATNLLIDSLIENSQQSNTMCVGHKNGDQHSSHQGTPTIQLHQVSDAVEDKVACDDVQIIDDMEPANGEEQPVKKRRLVSLHGGGDGILTESNL